MAQRDSRLTAVGRPGRRSVVVDGGPVTPADSASRLGVDAKRVRAWLRVNRPAPSSGRWDLDEVTLEELREDLSRGSQSLTRPRQRDRDEIYVVDLCDELFKVAASRQHRFDWLTGDPGKDGRRRSLPVDAYYESLHLVVEYREQQHDRPVAFFDKPDRLTVSGVHRGEQRESYDRRRDELIPQHGLRLWVVQPDDVAGNSRGRLARRDRERDLALLRSTWSAFEQGV